MGLFPLHYSGSTLAIEAIGSEIMTMVYLFVWFMTSEKNSN